MACQWSSGKISILHVLPLVWDDKMQNAYSLCSNFVKTTDLNGTIVMVALLVVVKHQLCIAVL